MMIPTPRDVAEARHAAALERALDALVARAHVEAWNEQVDDTVADIRNAAAAGFGACIEYSYTDNVIRAYPEPRLRPGTAALFNLDTGTHCHRDINPDQIGRTS
jgi:hypothetical protein